MKSFFKIFGKKKKSDFITVVSGLPRSGTSMMMKMLEAGGLAPLTDNLRTADDDNPKGYYEFERVKKLPEGDVAWLENSRGKAVKIISALLPHLPENYSFKIIFMSRRIEEVLASQKKMLIRRGEPTDLVTDEELTRLYQKHLDKTFSWLEAHRHHVSCLTISYNDLLREPVGQVSKVIDFLGADLNAQAMARVVDPALYRHREKK